MPPYRTPSGIYHPTVHPVVYTRVVYGHPELYPGSIWAPSWYTLGGVYPGICASRVPWVGVPPVYPGCVPPCIHLLLGCATLRITLLTLRLRKRGLSAGKSASSPLRNKPLSWQKPGYNAQETRYRKDLRTRSPGIFQPLKS